jgi:hypothetical protein
MSGNAQTARRYARNHANGSRGRSSSLATATQRTLPARRWQRPRRRVASVYATERQRLARDDEEERRARPLPLGKAAVLAHRFECPPAAELDDEEQPARHASALAAARRRAWSSIAKVALLRLPRCDSDGAPAPPFGSSHARTSCLIWRVVCQAGIGNFSHFWRSVCRGVWGSAGWVAVRAAVRDAGQTDIRGSGWPQDHGSSWGAAVYGIERDPGDQVAHRHIAGSPRVPGRHRPSRPRYVCDGLFVTRFG